MARNFTIPIRSTGFEYIGAGAAPDVVPTTLRPCAAFDADTDESVDIPFVVPAEFTGSGTLKMDIFHCANTITGADDVRWDAATEAKTPGASEAMNSANIDATPDSVTGLHSTTAYSLQKLTITLTPGTTWAVDDEVRVRLTRDANHSTDDSLAVDALVLSIEIYEEV